jgi:hypothetical protein
MDYRGATLIADYGHNPDAMRALVAAVAAMPAKRRSVVISGAGDRRDEDIREQTQILGTAFDEVILYQDACQRGREDGEVMGLLRQGLNGASRTSQGRRDLWRIHRHRHRAGPPAARRPVPGAGRPGGGSAALTWPSEWPSRWRRASFHRRNRAFVARWRCSSFPGSRAAASGYGAILPTGAHPRPPG